LGDDCQAARRFAVKPIKYVSILNQRYQSLGFPPYKWSVFKTTTWTPLEKPLAQCKVALLSAGGISLKGQPPYDPFSRDDLTFREIPKDVRAQDFVINYSYYDHTDADKDINCIFPIDRFRELEREGFIGEVAETHYGTGMGRMYKRTALQTQLAAEIASRLKAARVDALFCVPV